MEEVPLQVTKGHRRVTTVTEFQQRILENKLFYRLALPNKWLEIRVFDDSSFHYSDRRLLATEVGVPSHKIEKRTSPYLSVLIGNVSTHSPNLR